MGVPLFDLCGICFRPPPKTNGNTTREERIIFSIDRPAEAECVKAADGAAAAAALPCTIATD
jgi:hypothetical protein